MWDGGGGFSNTMENFGVEGQHDMKCVFMFRVVGTAD
jgi:hypothetical protein